MNCWKLERQPGERGAAKVEKQPAISGTEPPNRLIGSGYEPGPGCDRCRGRRRSPAVRHGGQFQRCGDGDRNAGTKDESMERDSHGRDSEISNGFIPALISTVRRLVSKRV